MNTQKCSTIGCAPVELLFRGHSTYFDWLDSREHKSLAVGVSQEDPNEPEILDSNLDSDILIDPALLSVGNSRVDMDIQSQSTSQVTIRFSPERGSKINARLLYQFRTYLNNGIISKPIFMQVLRLKHDGSGKDPLDPVPDHAADLACRVDAPPGRTGRGNTYSSTYDVGDRAGGKVGYSVVGIGRAAHCQARDTPGPQSWRASWPEHLQDTQVTCSKLLLSPLKLLKMIL